MRAPGPWSWFDVHHQLEHAGVSRSVQRAGRDGARAPRPKPDRLGVTPTSCLDGRAWRSPPERHPAIPALPALSLPGSFNERVRSCMVCSCLLLLLGLLAPVACFCRLRRGTGSGSMSCHDQVLLPLQIRSRDRQQRTLRFTLKRNTTTSRPQTLRSPGAGRAARGWGQTRQPQGPRPARPVRPTHGTAPCSAAANQALSSKTHVHLRIADRVCAISPLATGRSGRNASEQRRVRVRSERGREGGSAWHPAPRRTAGEPGAVS